MRKVHGALVLIAVAFTSGCYSYSNVGFMVSP